MISFLFWNLMGNAATWSRREADLQTSIARIVSRFYIDVLLFAESGLMPETFVPALYAAVGRRFVFHDSPESRIQVYSRYGERDIGNVFDLADGRLTIRRMRVEGTDWLLAVVHAPSQQHSTPTGRALEMGFLANDLSRAEDLVQHRRTLLVGDLNMDPFEDGVTAAGGLNAAMAARLASGEDRTAGGRAYRWFYNPLWAHFGDRTPGPPGSYYYRSSDHTGTHWHLFDQVLLRPALVGLLREVRILDTDGVDSLTTAQGRPRAGKYSDHFPLLFRLVGERT